MIRRRALESIPLDASCLARLPAIVPFDEIGFGGIDREGGRLGRGIHPGGNVGREWMRLYGERRFVTIDPLVKRSAVTAALVSSDELEPEELTDGRAQPLFRAMATAGAAGASSSELLPLLLPPAIFVVQMPSTARHP